VGVAVTVDYAELNRPQTIVAPTRAKPYRQLGQQLSGLEQSLEGSADDSGGAAGSGLGTYETCLQRSADNIAKLQKCASLIDSVNQ
jgi:hypothetical protein